MTRTLTVVALLVATGALVWLMRFDSRDETQPGEFETEVAVQVGEIRLATVRRYVTIYGNVEPEPAGAGRTGGGSRLAARVAGVVADVLCSEGERVTKGKTLFRLDSRVSDVEAEYARQQVERGQKLIAIGGTSKQALAEAERRLASARADQSLLQVDAPFAGIITRVFARPGEAVDPSSVLAELTDPDRLVATGGVPDAELDGLHPGMAVKLIPAVGEPVDAELSYVSSSLDPKTGLALVRAVVPPDSGLRAGQFLELRIVSEVRADRLIVPVESVFRDEDGGDAIAIVESDVEGDVEGDRARRIPVLRGLRDGDNFEVEGEGLKPGMRVVTVGAYGLPTQSRIRIVASE